MNSQLVDVVFRAVHSDESNYVTLETEFGFGFTFESAEEIDRFIDSLLQVRDAAFGTQLQ